MKENTDIKFLKKHYGENFAHLCRELFPTILETEGLLSKIISDHFAPSRSLYEDLSHNAHLEDSFKSYIFSLVDVEKEKPEEIVKLTPEELMDKAGYILYPECKTEEEIQSFKKYYKVGEELCTFRGGRLNTCRVWFAVKKNVDKIKREDFEHPERQDEYGTSVISIQFSRGSNSTLSIKNRYNHTVNNPDATFGNNLDNIITGLTDAFVNTYEINLINGGYEFEMPDYVLGSDGRFYRKNVEIDNIYYCENNVVIKPGEVEKIDKLTKILIDNYIVDLKNKKIYTVVPYAESEEMKSKALNDSFVKSIGETKNIKVNKLENGEREIIVTPVEGEDVKIVINKQNQIVEYHNENVTEIGNDFLRYNDSLRALSLPNVEVIGNYCADGVTNFLKELNLPKIKRMGDRCFNYAYFITEINTPQLQQIGDSCFSSCYNLEKMYIPKLVMMGDFCFQSLGVKEVKLGNLRVMGDGCFVNTKCSKISFPNLIQMGSNCFGRAENLQEILLPNLKEMQENCFYKAEKLENIEFPSLKEMGDECFYYSKKIRLCAQSLVSIGKRCFSYVEDVNFYLPNLTDMGDGCFGCCRRVSAVVPLTHLEKIGKDCFDMIPKEKYNEIFGIKNSKEKSLLKSEKETSKE